MTRAQTTIRQAIEIQQKCVSRYLEIYPQVKEEKIRLSVRITNGSFSTAGERKVMKKAISDIRDSCQNYSSVFFPYTKEALDVWIDRANVERVRQGMKGEQMSLFTHIPEQERLL